MLFKSLDSRIIIHLIQTIVDLYLNAHMLTTHTVTRCVEKQSCTVKRHWVLYKWIYTWITWVKCIRVVQLHAADISWFILLTVHGHATSAGLYCKQFIDMVVLLHHQTSSSETHVHTWNDFTQCNVRSCVLTNGEAGLLSNLIK